MEYIDGAPDDLAKVEQIREKERLRKRAQRETRRKAESLIPDKARPAPAQLRQKLGEYSRAIEPLGPGEATRQLKHATIGLGKLLNSDANIEDPDLADALQDAGAGLADASKVFWPLRLFIRLLIPLVIVGAFWRIGAMLVVNTPWWRTRQEKKRDKEERQGGALRVLHAPAGEAGPGGQQPPGPRPRKTFG